MTGTKKELLTKLFKRKRVLKLADLYAAISTKHRKTVFRHIKMLNYLTSYTHAGSYYTLPDMPQFDADGLWHYDNIGFSKHGTLKNTVLYLVKNSKAGKTHSELEKQLHIGVQNTLLDLVKSDQIARESGKEGVYLYVSKDAKHRKQQIKQRLENKSSSFTEWIVVDILVEIIRYSSPQIDVHKIFSRLKTRGSEATLYLVEKTIDDYELFWEL